MRTVSIVGVLSIAVAAALAGACADVKSPLAPTVTPESPPARPGAPPVPPSGVPPAFPAVSRSARVYVDVNPPLYPMHGSPLASRYVLYEDGTFALQYASANYPFFEYRGTYKEADAVITFEWEGCSCPTTGSLSGDSLSVQYTEEMHQSDFLDGVYVRTR